MEEITKINLKLGRKFQKIFKILTNKEENIKNHLDLELDSNSLKIFLEFNNQSFYYDLELKISKKQFSSEERKIEKLKKKISKKDFLKMIKNINTEKDLILIHKKVEEEITIIFEQIEITSKKLFDEKNNLFFNLKYISGKVIYNISEIIDRENNEKKNNFYINDFLTLDNLYVDISFSGFCNPFSFFFSLFLFKNKFKICFLKNKVIRLISNDFSGNFNLIDISENNLLKIHFSNFNDIIRDKFSYHEDNIYLLKNLLNGIYEKNNTVCDLCISIYSNGYIKIIFQIDKIFFKIFIASKYGN